MMSVDQHRRLQSPKHYRISYREKFTGTRCDKFSLSIPHQIIEEQAKKAGCSVLLFAQDYRAVWSSENGKAVVEFRYWKGLVEDEDEGL